MPEDLPTSKKSLKQLEKEGKKCLKTWLTNNNVILKSVDFSKLF